MSRVTTAGAAPSLGQYLLMAYLPPEHAVEGTELRVMYMNELFPVTRRPRRQPPAVRPRRHAHEMISASLARSTRSLRSVEHVERLRRTQLLAAASKLACAAGEGATAPSRSPDGAVPHHGG